MSLDQSIYLLVGSNIGDRHSHLDRVIEGINDRIGKVKIISSRYETSAWGIEDQAPFINMCLEMVSDLEPLALLKALLDLERDIGRVPSMKWGPREIDIDILFYGDRNIDHPDLKVPHPWLHLRRFALEPMVELAPDLTHPLMGKTMQELLRACPDTLKVLKLNPVDEV